MQRLGGKCSYKFDFWTRKSQKACCLHPIFTSASWPPHNPKRQDAPHIATGRNSNPDFLSPRWVWTGKAVLGWEAQRDVRNTNGYTTNMQRTRGNRNPSAISHILPFAVLEILDETPYNCSQPEIADASPNPGLGETPGSQQFQLLGRVVWLRLGLSTGHDNRFIFVSVSRCGFIPVTKLENTESRRQMGSHEKGPK